MSAKETNIFLTSAEHRGEWSRVRRGSIMGKITDGEGRNYLWVRVDPPVIGQAYGLGNRDIADLLLLPHYEGTSLFPISEFPLPVYIFRSLDEGIFKGVPASSNNLQLAAWGEIYDRREDAEAVGRRNSPTES
jgi:hypothetical protein